jgi:hypothetical protein
MVGAPLPTIREGGGQNRLTVVTTGIIATRFFAKSVVEPA